MGSSVCVEDEKAFAQARFALSAGYCTAAEEARVVVRALTAMSRQTLQLDWEPGLVVAVRVPESEYIGELGHKLAESAVRLHKLERALQEAVRVLDAGQAVAGV